MTSTEIRVPFLEGLKPDPKHSQEDLEHIRQWLSHMPHLPEISDDFIRLFLHANHNKLEDTKNTIDSYFTIRTHAPELFDNRDPLDPVLQSAAECMITGRTSGRTPEGYTVWFSRLIETDPSKFDLFSLAKLFIMLGDSFASQDGLSPGYIIVFDMKGVTLAHLAAITISFVRTCMNYVQYGIPIRVKNIHVINGGTFIERLMLLIKPFMNEAFKELLKIHASADVVSKLFPPEAIPRDYGGTGEDLAEMHALGRKSLETTYRPYVQHLSTLKVDESKRTVMASTEIRMPFMEGLKTVPKHSKDDVEHIRQWMSHMPHLPDISDDYIHLFLHANYSKLERTKTTIENYFTIRTHATELFSNRDALDPALQIMANNTMSGRASGRTPEGCTVWFNKLTETDPSKFDLISMIKLFFMLGDSYISQDGLSPGYIVVFDMKGVALGHLAAVTISLIKTCMNYIQEAAPIRVRSIHVINGGSLLERIMLLIKPFMKAELHELLHVHATTEELSKLFPPEAIPRDYGGTGEDLGEVHALARKSLETTYRPFLQHLSTLKVDESKRTGKSTAGEKLFGAEGSFRTLNFD